MLFIIYFVLLYGSIFYCPQALHVQSATYLAYHSYILLVQYNM